MHTLRDCWVSNYRMVDPEYEKLTVYRSTEDGHVVAVT
jgi:Uma2 family endonuclease